MSRVRELFATARRPPRGILAVVDTLAWLAAALIAVGLRYLDTSAAPPWGPAVLLGMVLGAMHVGLAYSLRLYSGRHRLGSVDEVLTLAAVIAPVALVGTLLLAIPSSARTVAISIPLLAGAIAGIAILGSRMVARNMRERAARPRNGAPSIIVGAGDAGTSLARDLLTTGNSPYLPVAFVDDDPGKQYYRVGGISVASVVDDLPELIRQRGIERILIAAPSAGPELYRRVVDLTTGLPVKVKSLPDLSELMNEQVGFSDLRDLEMTDLLGRQQVQTDLTQVAGYLNGRRVLVTGAGGSIGSELCRQIQMLGPSALGMLDRDESALHQLQLSLDGRGLLDTRNLILADIRDPEALATVMAEFRPEVVFHAAALKHLPMLQMYPKEGWKTNVRGTNNVIEAAADSGVGVFVNISTDKAADPSSALGRSKRLAEQLTAQAAAERPGRFVSVRFGNVLGSRGSVLTAFAEQIRLGGPVTITHPDVTRYFMTLAEAVQLVLQAGALGGSGDVMVLDMGTPVRIQDMAGQVIALSGKDIEIVYTGLRPGEKMHEVLASEHESMRPTTHPMIRHVPVSPIRPDRLLALESDIDLRESLDEQLLAVYHGELDEAATEDAVAGSEVTVGHRETGSARV